MDKGIKEGIGEGRYECKKKQESITIEPGNVYG